MSIAQVVTRMRRHWFNLLLPLWALASINLHIGFDWMVEPRQGELVALFDWVVFMPVLYAICYRASLSRRALSIRLVAMACSGIWVAGKIVPVGAEDLLLRCAWLRSVGVITLVAVEGLAMVAILRIAFSEHASARDLERQGIPPVLVTIMLAEARFWRWLWATLRGR